MHWQNEFLLNFWQPIYLCSVNIALLASKFTVKSIFCCTNEELFWC